MISVRVVLCQYFQFIIQFAGRTWGQRTVTSQYNAQLYQITCFHCPQLRPLTAGTYSTTVASRYLLILKIVFHLPCGHFQTERLTNCSRGVNIFVCFWKLFKPLSALRLTKVLYAPFSGRFQWKSSRTIIDVLPTWFLGAFLVLYVG